jgi:hypothetical protein
MSIRQYSDTGPSYIVHEPQPGRGPAICANCTHVNRQGFVGMSYCAAWTCDAAPVEIKRPAGTDPITGEHVPAWTIGVRCTARNKTGECPDFIACPSRRNGGTGDRGGKVDGGRERGGTDGEPFTPEILAGFVFAAAVTLTGIAAIAGWWG